MNRQATERLQALEDAINKVLFTQFKKDAKEAHALVESYGFKIDKYDGFFGVKNPETYKTLRLEECNGWRGMWIRETGTRKGVTDEEWRAKKLNIDVIKFLNTPYNYDWQYVENRDACEDGSSANAYHPTWDKKEKLRRARMNVKYCKDGIKRSKAEIDRLMNDIKTTQEYLLRETQDLSMWENRLADTLKELGLKKGA